MASLFRHYGLIGQLGIEKNIVYVLALTDVDIITADLEAVELFAEIVIVDMVPELETVEMFSELAAVEMVPE